MEKIIGGSWRIIPKIQSAISTVISKFLPKLIKKPLTPEQVAGQITPWRRSQPDLSFAIVDPFLS